MKVSGPGKTSGVSKSKKANKAQDGDEAFGDMMVSAAGALSGASGVSPTQSIAKVDALLAVQGAEGATEKSSERRLHKRGTEILDALESIRMAMLGGSLTIGHMIDIADVVASHRDGVDDPKLTAIMDEIDLRAQVELAKMQVILDNKSA